MSENTRADLGIWARTLGADVLGPAVGVRNSQRGEDLVVEAVLAQQQFVDHFEELAGLRPWMMRWS